MTSMTTVRGPVRMRFSSFSHLQPDGSSWSARIDSLNVTRTAASHDKPPAHGVTDDLDADTEHRSDVSGKMSLQLFWTHLPLQH
ncbi:Lysylphosphatidylglycerol biosynthesis bifunctional protein LysX [Clarias magur]|uniref:Lysylphosphatidylglycerol biosynthesis bifunctional protein LysX n=1 Tax=Clarias magur TaxID=1594786 RepID=A0A8J4U6R5_CLAMG|nr:Lysylphosphatidylglycerol biosynthesis bifunctional protein LysX [Clarias magur]